MDLLPAFLHDDVSIQDVKITRAENACATKFEQAQVIGFRASELAQGAEPRARPDGGADTRFDPLKIAAAEWDANVITGIDVVRTKPDGTQVAIECSAMLRTQHRNRLW